MSDASETMVVLTAPPKRRCLLWSVSIVVPAVAMLAVGFIIGWFMQALFQTPTTEAHDSPVVVELGSGAVHDDEVVMAAAEVAAQRLIAQAQEVPYWQRELDPARRLAIMGSIESGAIEDKLRWLSMRTRLAGSESSRKYAEDLVNMWKSYGFLRSGMESYKVLLSFPGNTEPRRNKVQLLTLGGMVLHESPSYPSNNSSPYPYTPYARPGEAEGAIVYVGAGKAADFALLQERGVNFTDTIVLVSSTYPPLTVARIAADYGCTGLITFPDPTQGAQTESGSESDSNPDADADSDSDSSPGSIPDDTIQPDAIRISPARPGFGDLRTPRYPSKAHTSRQSAEKTRQLLSTIPIQPVSIETATALLESVANDTPLVEGFWSPEGPGVAPRVGGKMKHSRRVRLAVYNYLREVPIYNAFAMIRGEIEEDRLVIIGAHRDSWGHGALDDASGTAVLMEIARVFGQQVQLGWRPRRTIIFASWGAEEFGLIGSTEWVQEKLGVLQHKAVAYLNLDVAVTGTDFLYASASPLLHNLIFNISALVPHTQHSSVLAAWADYARQRGTSPTVYQLYPVSDHTPFAFMAGVPAADVLYANQHRNYYSAYHTQYDTFNYIKTHIDPTFAHHKMVAQIVAEMLHQLADYRLLPLSVAAYADVLHRRIMAFTVTTFPWLMAGEGKELIGHLEKSVESFVETAMEFQHNLRNLDKKDPYKLRQVNDRLMLVERAFIDPAFQQDPNSIFRHVLLSPGQHECPPFQSWFPRVQDVICNPEYAPYLMDEEIPAKMMDDLRDQVTLLCQTIDTATDILII